MVLYAEDRSCTTQFELGEMFCRGDSRSRDYDQAFNWYARSAKKGYRRAQHRLGTLYARGQGVARNYVKAYAWCKVSAYQKSIKAMRKLRRIEAYMSPEQIRDGRQLAQRYYNLYVSPGITR